MMQSTKQSLAVFANQAAANSPELEAAVDALRRDGYRVVVFTALEIDPALVNDWDVMVAAGGDGTFGCVASAVIRSGKSDVPVGIVPFGTGNDFATACGIPTGDPAAALQMILEGKAKLMDVGKVGKRFFFNVVSGGLGAEVTANTSEELKTMLGRLAYTVSGISVALQESDRRAIIRGQDLEWEGSLLFLSIANGRLAGGGYHVAPEALLDDGQLDVLIVPETGILEAPSMLVELFSLGTMDHALVQYVRTPWLEVHAPKGMQLTIDGEPSTIDHCRIEVQPRRLRVIVPPQAPFQCEEWCDGAMIAADAHPNAT